MVNYYKSFSSITGGVDPSPTFQTVRFFFAVKGNITMPNIQYNEQLLELKKGDTIVFNWSYESWPYEPYDDIQDSIFIPTEPVMYTASRSITNNYYHVGIFDLYHWNRLRTYEHKGKQYTAVIKEDWDAYNVDAAP